MAIRKFRKHIKPFIWFITVLFILSSAMLAYMNMRSSYDRTNIYALKLNGKKISKIDVEKTKNNLTQGYSRFLGDKVDRELVEVLAFDDVINRNLTLEIADKLNVKVPSKEVNAQYESIENSIGNKEQFRRMLAAQGYTKKTFKIDIENSMIIEKTFQKIKDGIVPTEQEIESKYSAGKYTLYNGKELTEVKDQIVNNIKEQKGMEEYLTLLEQARNSAKIENIAPEYENLVEKVEIDKDGFKITNVDLAKKTLNTLYATNGNREEADAQVKSYYDEQINLAKEALNRGITVNEDFPVDYKLDYLQKMLFENIRAGLKPTDKDMEEYFKNNSLKYDTFPSAQAEIAVVQVEPSTADKERAKKEAENILVTLTPENFKDKAKEYSTGPSAENGGELGWFSKGDMVEPFQKAVFEGKVGEVYPTPVETVFGYHLILIEDRKDEENRAKASHILFTPTLSEETTLAKAKEIDELKSKLQNNEISFKDLTKDRKDVIQSNNFKINNAGYISGLGYNDVLAKTILDAPSNKVESFTAEDKIYIFNKVEDIKYKKAKYEDVKDRVREDYLNSKTQEEIKKYI